MKSNVNPNKYIIDTFTPGIYSKSDIRSQDFRNEQISLQVIQYEIAPSVDRYAFIVVIYSIKCVHIVIRFK